MVMVVVVLLGVFAGCCRNCRNGWDDQGDCDLGGGGLFVDFYYSHVGNYHLHGGYYPLKAYNYNISTRTSAWQRGKYCRNKCMATRIACKVARNTCKVAWNTCKVARNTCKVARNSCKVARNTCKLARNTCKVVRNTCKVARNMCKETGKMCISD